jgi:16S rRNA (guanine527-N7)-methyltransferase
MAAEKLRRCEQRIEALGGRYGLPSRAVAQLSALLRVLVEDPFAPTAVRDPLKAVEDHLADALVALDLEVVRSASRIADLGSGAGIPGLPLAIALPGAEVALIDSIARRCTFLERVVAACDARNVRVVQSRIESWTEGLDRFDLVTARALAPLGTVTEYAAPILRLGGTLMVWRGRRNPDEEKTAARAAAEIGLEQVEIVPVRPYPAAKQRHLYLMSKVMETPPRFPRRPGMALKRPLGSGGRTVGPERG